MSRLPAALVGLALCAGLAGCGSGAQAEDAGVVARLDGAGFAVACAVTGELHRKAASGPTVPVKILRRGALVAIVVRAESADAARKATAVNVHRTSRCPRYRHTLAHRVLGRAVVLAAVGDGGATTGAEVNAAMRCAARAPCAPPPRVPAGAGAAAKKRPSRHARRPRSAYDRGFAALSPAPPLRPVQLTSFADRHQVVASVAMRRFCALTVAARQHDVAAFARSVAATFARFGVHGIRVFVSVPSETGRVVALARAVDGKAGLTSRGARTAGCARQR